MDVLKELETKKPEIIQYFKNQLAQIRGGRPTAKLVENIQVDYLGQKLRVMQLGSISVVLPREIQISVWERGAVPLVAKGIAAVINVQPSVEENLIRLNLPPLSAERRAELTKVVKQGSEEIKIKVRSLRDELLKKVKRQEEEKKISEDERFNLRVKIEEGIRKINEEIDKSLDNKIKEINE